jgi:glycosyltransferase involved in cell wall biosynthesis
VKAARAKTTSATERPGLFLMVNTLERGGTERQFVTLAQGLSSGRFELGTGCLGRRGEFVDSLPRVAEFSPGRSLFKLQSQLARISIARHLRRHHVAVAHAFDFYTNLMLIPAGRLAGVPVVLGSHRQLGDLLTPLQFRAQNAAFRMCDTVVCNSRAAAERLKQTGIAEDKLAVIPNAMPDEAFAETTAALPRESGRLRVGMIARMNDAVKNYPMFLRMATHLSQKFPNTQFVLVGDGPLRPELERMASELGLGRQALFLGDRRDVQAVLASLDVTVLPSRSESLSNAILESMAAGVPVVATDVGGNSEIIANGDTGFLVALDDHALAQAVENLLTNDDLRRRCGTRAKLEASSQYRLSVIRDRYEQLYMARLLAKAGPQELRKVRSLA